MKIYNSVTDLIGHTPLMVLENYCRLKNLQTKIIAKLEFFNPAGSVKDRIAKAMIEDAENKGLIDKNTVIIEPTSGNTGIGLASVAVSKGYRVILTMPDTMSVERRKLLAAYGAEIVLTDGAQSMQGAIEKANELAKLYTSSYIPGQFTNPANPETHFNTTGVEIWDDTDGKVDIFVAGVGTGGTITGTGTNLKSRNPDIKVAAVEPAGSPVLSGGKPGAHKLQGIGAGFVPEILDTSVYDEIIAVTDGDAYSTCREITRSEGILVGVTSGAAVWAAAKFAERAENAGKMIVALLPDSGERYLSTGMF